MNVHHTWVFRNRRNWDSGVAPLAPPPHTGRDLPLKTFPFPTWVISLNWITLKSNIVHAVHTGVNNFVLSGPIHRRGMLKINITFFVPRCRYWKFGQNTSTHFPSQTCTNERTNSCESITFRIVEGRKKKTSSVSV